MGPLYEHQFINATMGIWDYHYTCIGLYVKLQHNELFIYL